MPIICYSRPDTRKFLHAIFSTSALASFPHAWLAKIFKKVRSFSTEVILPIDISVSPLNPRENIEQPSCSCQSFLTLWPISMIVNHQARHQELYDVAKEASNGPISVGRLVVSIKYDTFPVWVGHFTRNIYIYIYICIIYIYILYIYIYIWLSEPLLQRNQGVL